MRKKIFSLLTIIALLVCTINVQALADGEEIKLIKSNDVGLRYTYITVASTTLSINSSGTATTSSYVTASSSIDKVILSSFLQKQSSSGWTTIKSWSKTCNSTSGGMSNTINVSEGSYRVITYFYAYDGSNCESTNRIAYDTH